MKFTQAKAPANFYIASIIIIIIISHRSYKNETDFIGAQIYELCGKFPIFHIIFSFIFDVHGMHTITKTHHIVQNT